MSRKVDLRALGEVEEQIKVALATQTDQVLRRRGVVVAMSGGVDSSVCAALAVRALGAERVFGLLLPERDSDPHSLVLGRALAQQLGIAHTIEEITAVLEACGCYRRRDDAIRRIVPEYREGWRCKIALPVDRLNTDQLSIFHLSVQSPEGDVRTARLPPVEYREILAASNFKQRVRKMLEYYHADRLHYAVLGTPNRIEYDQGFFVKGGDGLADLKPIAHLYKSEVYRLAEHLGIPKEIISRPPSTDTYSMPQSQEEFYFSLPSASMSLVLWGHNTRTPPEDIAKRLDLSPDQVRRAYRDIDNKRVMTRYLHLPPLLVEPVPEVPS